MDSFQHPISKKLLGAVLQALPAYPFLCNTESPQKLQEQLTAKLPHVQQQYLLG